MTELLRFFVLLVAFAAFMVICAGFVVAMVGGLS